MALTKCIAVASKLTGGTHVVSYLKARYVILTHHHHPQSLLHHRVHKVLNSDNTVCNMGLVNSSVN